MSPTLGSGQTLRTFVVGIQELLKESKTVKSVEFPPLPGEPQSPCSSLQITVAQRTPTSDALRSISNPQNNPSDIDESPALAAVTDEGHQSMLRYCKDEQPEDLKHAIVCFERAIQECPPTHLCRAVVLFNLATARLLSSQCGISSPDFDVPITLYGEALDLRPLGHPDRPATLLHLACASFSRFSKWGDKPYAQEARNLLAQVQDVCSVDSYEYQLVDTILLEFPFGKVTDGHSTVFQPPNFHAPVLEPLPQEHAKFQALSLALWNRFRELGRRTDLDGSIKATEKVVELIPENRPEWPHGAISLGTLFDTRFRLFNNIEDLERSISLLDKAIQHMTDSHHPDLVIGLIKHGILLLERFDRLEKKEDVDMSISAQERALEILPGDHWHRPLLLTHLGIAFLRRFECIPNPTDLEKSISSMEEATQHARKDDAESSPIDPLEEDIRVFEHLRLANLGRAVCVRFNYIGHLSDLNRSISLTEEALRSSPKGHRNRPSSLANLGRAFLSRYQRRWSVSDLHNAYALFVEALRLVPKDSPRRPEILIFFGLTVLKFFERFGKIADIDKSIFFMEQALHLTADDHPNKPFRVISLGSAFLKRFQCLGDPADLEKSTWMMEEAVRSTPEDHPDRQRRLSLIGEAYMSSFARLGQLSDLDKSILTLEEATKHALAEPDTLSVLSRALLMRAKRLGNAVDLDMSIVVGERAVQLTPEGDPVSPLTLNTLGASFLGRFLLLGDSTDLDKANTHMEQALNLTPQGHPDRLTMLTNIGDLFVHRFLRLSCFDALHSAISYFSQAASYPVSSLSSKYQVQAFKYWLGCAALLRLQAESNVEVVKEMLKVFACGITLVSKLAWIGLPLTDRYTELIEASDITRLAVSFAIGTGYIVRGVEWLEQGRCVVWGQLFSLRTPLDELLLAHPHLAGKLEWVSYALKRSSSNFEVSSLPIDGGEEGQRESLELRARRHRELVAQREELINKARALPGFERLFLPKTFSQLRACAQLGPIILLNVNVKQADALIVVADMDRPLHVPLLDINDKHVGSLRAALSKLLWNDGRVISRNEVDRAARTVPKHACDFGYVLRELWFKVVQPILYILSLTTPGELTRVFWCPTGPFSFLPLHAAGDYSTAAPGNKASDFIISSYIPTLNVLAASHESSVVSNNVRLLVVPQPSSDGQPRLSCVPDEVVQIRETIKRRTCTRVQLRESASGNVEDVLEAMEQSDWVHFACHGVQDPERPTNSGLCLADGRRLRLSDIVRLTRPTSGGGFAFLSACQTATGAEQLSDEAVHLAAGMLFAGYSSVVGTMWSIQDSVAPRVARDVYEQLFRSSPSDEGGVDKRRPPDSREAARALHVAIERLRQSGEPFFAWVPFIHMGV